MSNKDDRAVFYARHKDRVIKSVKQNKLRLKQKMTDFKRGKKCLFCSENESVCLDFHHLPGTEKKFNLGCAPDQGISWEKILLEIEKCILICSNCHRKIHSGILKAEKNFNILHGLN